MSEQSVIDEFFRLIDGHPLEVLSEKQKELIQTFWENHFGPCSMLYLSELRSVSAEKSAGKYSMRFALRVDPDRPSNPADARILKLELSVDCKGFATCSER